MTELHAGHRVPPAELDEIPMGNHNPVQNVINEITGRQSGEYRRRIDSQNYWNFVIQHRLAVVLGSLLIATIITVIGVTTYLAITPVTNYTEVDIEKITEIEYPETDDELEDRLGRREPGLGASEEFSPDTLAALKKLMYDTDHPEEESKGFRLKREVEVASVESCKERHKNCKILLGRVKKLTKNVSNQVHQLHRMINRLGILNEELPSMKNFTVVDFNACLQCEKLEKETERNYTFSQNTTQALNITNATESYVEHLVNTANLTKENISMVVNENPEELLKTTESPSASSASSNSTTAPQEVTEVMKPTNSSQEALEVKPVPTDPEQVYSRPSHLNSTSSGTRMEAAKAVYSNPGPSTANVTEVPSTPMTEVPDEDHQKIVTSIHSPDSKATYEPNPFLIPTAETSKTSQQMTYTPNVSWMPYPLCVYGPPNPPPQSVRQSSSRTISFPVSSLTSPTSYAPYNVNFVQPVQQIQTFVQHAQPVQQGFQVLPMQFQPNSVPVQPQYGPTGPSVPYFPVNQAGHPPAATGQGRPIYCTYMPTPTFQFPVVPGISEFQRTVQDPEAQIEKGNEKGDAWNKFEDQELKSRDYAAGCPPNTRTCNDRSHCIPISRWCDGEVDCADASDETRCSCRDRVDKDRICDGYFDCPLGEDELGCNGCDKRSFSCDESEDRRRRGNCVPLVQRCDGYADCPNGKDETDCNIITRTFAQQEVFTVGYTVGYLHKNFRGKWYPVCTPSKPWANDACRTEIRDENYTDFPEIETVTLRQTYRGPYVVELPNNQVEIVESCSGTAVFVNCPAMVCGTRVPLWQDDSAFGLPYSEHYRSEDEKLGGTLKTSFKDKNLQGINTTDNNEDSVLGASRVVGGHPSQPRAWPSLVAINRDGSFHCGGVILDEWWILTAAHCIDSYQKHYYDIQAGILRRFSYSPMEQSSKVSHVVEHPAYDKIVMKNDIAMVRLERPLNFNRWVRPACLPEINTAGPSWRTGPPPQTTCVSAGWGSTVEHGPDPDHLREVELPILANCKYPDDRNEAEICAGMPQGGRDTCQGDSGGPLMCRNPNSPTQWYVAGIVSHGEGCARPNEPGAYTKVSRFVDWIDRVRLQRELPSLKPLARCPGYYCTSGSRRCYSSKRRCDKNVDCLDAEDEIHCQRLSSYASDFSLYKTADFNGRDFLDVKSTDVLSIETTTVAENLTTETETETTVETLTTGETQSISDSKSSSSTEPVSTSTEMTTVEITETTTSKKPDEILITDQSIEKTTEYYSSTMKPIIENSTNVTKEIQPLRHFSCKILIQTIDLSKRCDRSVDCQDGTDEEDCTCRDYLAKIEPASICDGHIDCLDVSDEENCEICSPEEFHCKRSKECVPMSKRCDRKGDCAFNEDELGCVALTNGKYVITDIDGQPHHNTEGILTYWENGNWIPFCMDKRPNKPATLGKQMCSYFAFMGCESFNQTRMHNAPLEVHSSTSTNLIPYEHPLTLYDLEAEKEPSCTVIYIRCIPTIHTVSLAYRVKAIDGGQDTFLWPWHAAIFVDGRYKCGAVLLEPSWLLTSVRCTDNLDLSENYTVALLGASRSYLHVDGPHQQLRQVDEIRTVKNSDAVLLHLKYPTNMTRHVQPLYLQKRTHGPAEPDTCATVGVDNNGRTRTIFLQAVLHNCPDGHRCYKNVYLNKCENETINPWSGVVFCFGCSGWYPAAVYHEEMGACSFSTKRSFSGIDYMNTNIITGMHEALDTPTEEPKCDGFRCPIGDCIDSKKVCDGVPNCRDGADEDPGRCRDIKDHCGNSVDDTIGCNCAQSELRCASGHCVPKSSFCDGNKDCSDGSDEPSNCTCAAYLKLTTPELICDGRRHCFDKTDESSDTCLCKDASFKCEQSGRICVPADFVCDGYDDCASGEDEKHCQSLSSLSKDPPGYELIQRSHGVWHSKCFPAGALSDDTELINLCKDSGYSRLVNVTEIDSSSSNSSSLSPVVPEIDKFYIVRLNHRAWIVMRDDKALVSLHPPQETCYRHYVTCV